MKTFPIMASMAEQREIRKGVPLRTEIPWDVIAPFEKFAMANHDQTLERLAERGGLSPCEAIAVMEGRKWRQMDPGAARSILESHVRVWASEEVNLKSDV